MVELVVAAHAERHPDLHRLSRFLDLPTKGTLVEIAAEDDLALKLQICQGGLTGRQRAKHQLVAQRCQCSGKHQSVVESEPVTGTGSHH